MPVYRIEMEVAATAYIKAANKKEALKIAKSLPGQAIDAESDTYDEASDIPVSGRQYDDPKLPDVSFSPAMTIQSLYEKDVDRV